MESGLFITNLKSTVDEKTIRSYFEKFGKVIYLNLQKDKFHENCKVCYINFNSIDSASKALSATDKSVLFGDQLRVSYKKISPNFDRNSTNGNVSISRTQSFGRGRGISMDTARNVRVVSEPIWLRNIDIPIREKFQVEIVTFDNVNNILVCPFETNDKQHITEILSAINENTHTLVDVKVPEINGFYLAKWQEDDNFYRAKLLEKLGDGTYKVCFVDEGTSGDITSVIKEIPKEISEFPCQFIPCAMECENSPEFINFIISLSENSKVSIYVSNPELKDGRYKINLFVGNSDVVQLYKKNHGVDVRNNKFPNESSLKNYKINTEFTNYEPLSYPKQERDLFKIKLLDKSATMMMDISVQGEPLSFLPIPGDVIVYRESPRSSLHRCVVQSSRFVNDKKIYYDVRLIDEDRTLEVDRDSLLKIDEKSLVTQPPVILTCVMNLGCKFLTIDSKRTKIKIVDCDTKKNIYVLELVPEPADIARDKMIMSSPGDKKQSTETIRVFVSHVETYEHFYVQMADNKSIMDLENIQYEINNSDVCSKFNSLNEIKVNQLVIAPFENVNYRALIKEINKEKSLVKVYFIDYGNCEWVKINDIFDSKSHVASIPPKGLRCQLPICVEPINQTKVNEFFIDYSGVGDDVEISLLDVQSQSDGGLLCRNLLAENKTSFVDILKFKKLWIDSAPGNSRTREILLSKIENLESRIRDLEIIQFGK